MPREDFLFSKNDLGGAMRAQEASMNQEVDAMDAKQLLGTPPDKLAAYFAEKYRINPIVLHEDRIQVDQTESRKDVSRDPNNFAFYRDREGPVYANATQITYYLPFSGDAPLLTCRPSSYTYNPPRAAVQGSELHFTYLRTDHDPAAVKGEFDRDLANIKGYVATIATDVAPFNESLPGKAQARIDARRERLIKSQDVVAGLGFPVRRREGAPQTFAVPEVKRKLPMPPTPNLTAAGQLEPMLDMETYEQILRIMSNMVAVMEQSPEAFRTMDEEAIRQHFLVQLNGQFEGQATGETFNFEGKTDILIRIRGRNIFIGECKFWEGPKAFDAAITQLMGYTTWRDTKTAILLFNRGRKLSTVLEKVPEVVRARPEFVREHAKLAETSFRYSLHHRDDPAREVLLTVLVFEVPAPNQPDRV